MRQTIYKAKEQKTEARAETLSELMRQAAALTAQKQQLEELIEKIKREIREVQRKAAGLL